MVSYIAVEVPELYPYVLLVTAAISFECLIVGFAAGGMRSKIFTREVMSKFDQYYNSTETGDFTAAGGKEAPKGGYPDLGNGLHSLELSYKDWYEFQLAQRTHKNFLETLTIVSFCALICGLIYPILTLVCVSLIFVGRIIYTLGYRTSVRARMLGAPIIMLTPVVLMIATIVGCSFWISATNQALSA